MRTGLLLAAWCVSTTAGAVTTGAMAPDFSLKDQKNLVHKLQAQRGKYVVLEWHNPECPFVKKHYETGNLPRLQKEWTGKGVVWFTINSSAPGKSGYLKVIESQTDLEKYHAAVTAALRDEDGRVGRQYGAKTTPHMYVINPDGRIIYEGAIDDQNGTDPSQIQLAKNYVAQALTEAMANKPVSVGSQPAYGCSIKYKTP